MERNAKITLEGNLMEGRGQNKREIRNERERERMEIFTVEVINENE